MFLPRPRMTLICSLGALAISCALDDAFSNAEESEVEARIVRDSGDLDLGEAGAGSLLELSCDSSTPPRLAGSCEPTDTDSTCQLCVQRNCCSEQAACNASQPDSSCAFGSTLYAGRPIEGGEIGCMMECWTDRKERGLFEGSQQDLEACSLACGASECERDRIGDVTQHLAACIIGGGALEQDCTRECGLAP